MKKAGRTVVRPAFFTWSVSDTLKTIGGPRRVAIPLPIAGGI
jgi:hypothetical protein